MRSHDWCCCLSSLIQGSLFAATLWCWQRVCLSFRVTVRCPSCSQPSMKSTSSGESCRSQLFPLQCMLLFYTLSQPAVQWWYCSSSFFSDDMMILFYLLKPGEQNHLLPKYYTPQIILFCFVFSGQNRDRKFLRKSHRSIRFVFPKLKAAFIQRTQSQRHE